MFYTNNYRGFSDFNIIQYGSRDCAPGFAPALHIRKTYLVHYVYEGEGTLLADDKLFPVSKGQAFMIFPGQLTTYTASEENPFSYRWVEFYGDKAAELVQSAHLSPEKPIFTDSPSLDAGNALKRLVDGGVVDRFLLMERFYAFAAALVRDKINDKAGASRYVDAAVNYVRYRSSAKTTVAETADYLHVSRSYLSHHFSEIMGVSLKKYILTEAMNDALLLLKNDRLSVGEIARILGYDSTEEFTKAFTRHFGKSPSKFRNNSAASLPDTGTTL